jgi:chorismate mutase
MTADVVDKKTDDSRNEQGSDAQANAVGMDLKTGAAEPLAADEIRAMRERIDEIDQSIIDLWLERARLSQEVGRTRMASGGTRLVLSREREIVERFREALGADGAQVALMILRAGRGPL